MSRRHIFRFIVSLALVGAFFLSTGTRFALADLSIETGFAKSISGDAATLTALINPGGASTIAWFEYSDSLATPLPWPKVFQMFLGSGTLDIPFTARLTGLSPQKEYFVRVGATQTSGIDEYGTVTTFTTLAAGALPTDLPKVKTRPAQYISQTTAILQGTVDPLGQQTIAYFQFDTDSALSTSPQIGCYEGRGSSTGDLNYECIVSGLTANTRYYFRARAFHDENAIADGQTLSFKTLSGEAPPQAGNQSSTGEGASDETPSTDPVIEETGGIVTCKENCGYIELIDLVRRIIDFLLFTLSLPIAAGMFMYAGFLYLSSQGESGKLTKARGIFWNVLVGLVIAMAAWLIVNTLVGTLLDENLQNEPGYNLLGDSQQE
ncbi:MAG: pilin [Candidatus Pacebacteria bacterium]|jgi:hypothetical protein|nr:pilin [Candidatus Paceibacterota bacterium]